MGGVGKGSGNTSGSQGYSDANITSKITINNVKVTDTHINETVRRVQEGIELISRADPILSRALSKIMPRMSFDLTYDTGRDMAYAVGLGKIVFNTATYGTKGDPTQLTKFTEGGRFHPAEGGSFTFIHEMGHILSNKYTLPPNVRIDFGDFDAAEIIGYKCPYPQVREWWHDFYLRMVDAMHLQPETEEHLDERLSDTV